MYTTTVDATMGITVTNGKFSADYALDGSAMNPLEAFYASLAACAAVFTKKACKSLGISPAGVEIACKPFAGAGGPLTLGKFKTEVRFPEGFTAEQKAVILDSIQHCAVKEIVKDGASIEFLVSEV